MKKLLLALSVFTIAFTLTACEEKIKEVEVEVIKEVEVEKIVEVEKELPALPTEDFTDINDVDDYLGRPDVQYVDLRNFDDKMKSGYIEGFEFIPFFDYLQYTGALGKDADWVWDGTEAINVATLNTLFSKDKTIFLMCGSGTRAGYVKDALLANGYTDVINVGGIGSYTGDHKVLGDGSYVLDPAPKGSFTPGVHVGYDTVGGYFVTVTVNDLGAIVDVVFDAAYRGTTKQALGPDYNMRTTTKGQTWAEMANDLADFVIANQGFGDMAFTETAFDASWNALTVPNHVIETDVANSPDAVAGVTVGMEGIVLAWNDAMMSAMPDGSKDIDVDLTAADWAAAHEAPYAYTPGVYYGVDTVGGYTAKVTVDADGFITEVLFDAIYNGTTKQALGEAYRMRTATKGQTWAEMANDLADFVVENQGFGEMSFTFTEFDPTWTALTVPHHVIETDVANSPDDVAGVTVGMEGIVYAWNLAIAQASDSGLGLIDTEFSFEEWQYAHRAPFQYEDGVYYGYEGGYSALVTVENGMVASVFLDAIHCRDLSDPADGIKESCNSKHSYTPENYGMNYEDVINDNGTPLDPSDDFVDGIQLKEGKLSWWQMAEKLGKAVVDAQTWGDWMVVDGDFAFDYNVLTFEASPWVAWTGEGGVATVEIVDAQLEVDVTTVGSQTWAVQVYQEGFAVENGKFYRISFDAKAGEAKDLIVAFGDALDADPWFTDFAAKTTFNLTTDMATYTLEFEMTEATTADQGKLVFELSTAVATMVTIDNVMIEEITALGGTVVADTDMVVEGDFFEAINLDDVAGVTIGISGWQAAIEEALDMAKPVDLFISEYIEGSSNNKAIEIYNPTGADVDLSDYALGEFYNMTGFNMVQLSGTLAAGEVYVICTDQVTAGNALEAECDLNLSYPSPVHFNGDDVVQLLKNNVVIDEIGYPADAGGDNYAKDVTLVRNVGIMKGSNDYDPSEWTVYAQDTFDYIGSHSVE